MKGRWDLHHSIVFDLFLPLICLCCWIHLGCGKPTLAKAAPSAKHINSSRNIISTGQDLVLLSPLQQQGYDSQPEPYFDKLVPRNVSAIASQTAFLHCRVFNLGLHTVSWIRQRDLHILTTGTFSYTSDHRFSVVQNASMKPLFTKESVPEYPAEDHGVLYTDWVLEIKYVQSWDAGTYECQISTEPRISTDVYLTVIESRAHIWGPPEKYVRKGSSLLLVCQVREAQEDATLFWYHDQHVVDDHQPSHGVILSQSYDTHEGLVGRLYIEHAALHHSGNYSCLPVAADPAHVLVHVINGEHPAAMQRSNKGLTLHANFWIVISTCVLVQMVCFSCQQWLNWFCVVPLILWRVSR